jgi:hypothetical protein
MTAYMNDIEDIKLNAKSYLVKIHCISPVFFISERDVLDKRIEFEYNGYHYNYTSSVNEDVKKLRKYFLIFLKKR